MRPAVVAVMMLMASVIGACSDEGTSSDPVVPASSLGTSTETTLTTASPTVPTTAPPPTTAPVPTNPPTTTVVCGTGNNSSYRSVPGMCPESVIGFLEGAAWTCDEGTASVPMVFNCVLPTVADVTIVSSGRSNVIGLVARAADESGWEWLAAVAHSPEAEDWVRANTPIVSDDQLLTQTFDELEYVLAASGRARRLCIDPDVMCSSVPVDPTQ